MEAISEQFQKPCGTTHENTPTLLEDQRDGKVFQNLEFLERRESRRLCVASAHKVVSIQNGASSGSDVPKPDDFGARLSDLRFGCLPPLVLRCSSGLSRRPV